MANSAGKPLIVEGGRVWEGEEECGRGRGRGKEEEGGNSLPSYVCKPKGTSLNIMLLNIPLPWL